MRKRYKVLLLLLLPVVIIVSGLIFDIPYTGTIGFLIILFYILLGNFYGTDRFKDN